MRLAHGTAAILRLSYLLCARAISPFTRRPPAAPRQASVKVKSLLFVPGGRALRERCALEVTKTSERDISFYESHMTVRSRPDRDCCAHLSLPDHLSTLSLGPISAFTGLLATPAGVVSEPSDGCRSLLSRSLSGGELPLDYLNGPSAAAADAAAPCAAARVSRAKRVDDVSGHGRVGGGARASIATGRAAAAALARPGAASAWLPVAAVPAVGDLGSCGPSAGDFCVSHVRMTVSASHVHVGSKTLNSLGAEPSARPRGQSMHCTCVTNE